MGMTPSRFGFALFVSAMVGLPTLMVAALVRTAGHTESPMLRVALPAVGAAAVGAIWLTVTERRAARWRSIPFLQPSRWNRPRRAYTVGVNLLAFAAIAVALGGTSAPLLTALLAGWGAGFFLAADAAVVRQWRTDPAVRARLRAVLGRRRGPGL